MELLTCSQSLPGNVYQLLETVIRRLNVTLASRLELLTPLCGNSDQIAWPAKPKYARVYYGHVSNMRLLCSDWDRITSLLFRPREVKARASTVSWVTEELSGPSSYWSVEVVRGCDWRMTSVGRDLKKLQESLETDVTSSRSGGMYPAQSFTILLRLGRSPSDLDKGWTGGGWITLQSRDLGARERIL